MAQLNGREEKFDSYLNKTIILSSKYYFKKQMKIKGKEQTILNNEEYSLFLQRFITEKDTFSSVERVDTSLQLKKALESLSAIEQAVIVLLFQEELTQQEAAEILEVYTKTISKIKIRAINKLKKHLEEDL